MRTAKSCGSDVAVLASRSGEAKLLWDNGGKRAVLRGEHEVSRKAIAQGRPECSRCPVCSCALLFAQIARETAGAASTRSSLRPLISGREVSSRTRAVHVARSRTHTQSSSPGLTGRPSIPETPMIESISRGVLDTPPSRGMTIAWLSIFHRHCLRQTRSVCARERSDKAIHLSACRAVDCFAALAMTRSDFASSHNQNGTQHGRLEGPAARPAPTRRVHGNPDPKP